MSSKIGQRFVKRQSQFKARGGNKRRTARTSINTIIKRAYNNAGASSRYMRSISAPKESGYVDLGITTYEISSNAATAIFLLNTVAQGAGIQQRVGKKIQMTSLQHRGQIANLASAILNDVSLMIVYDKRPTGALPAVTDILKSQHSQAMNNDDNVPSRFMILKRWNQTLIGNTTAAVSGMEAMNSDFYMPCRLPVVYKALASGAIGDIEEGALYLMLVGSNVNGSNIHAALAGSFRLRFVDV